MGEQILPLGEDLVQALMVTGISKRMSALVWS
jgi:hypothetical protein